ARYWMLDTGYSLLVARYWMLDTRYSLPVIQHSPSPFMCLPGLGVLSGRSLESVA
ncbi:MAG: hypothetical protein JRD05_07465, partial [Deltaproteobacteria bacterium]|nr:hypothetical protein [Deltaproteobacteria bacterium]